jgi:PAS domain S-box-containing protein
MSKRKRQIDQRLNDLFSTADQPEEATGVEQPSDVAQPIGPAAAPAADLILLKAAIDQVPLPAYVKDREHTWVAVNAAFAQLLGQTPETLFGRTDKEQADDAWQLDDRVLDNGQAETSEETTTLPDGAIRTRRTRRTPLSGAANEARYVMGVVEEVVTLAPGTHTHAPDSDETFHAAMDAIPSPVIISRIADDVILYANQAFSAFTAVSLEQVIGQRAVSFYADSRDRERVAEGVQQQGELHGFEVRMRRTDASILWVSLSIRRLKFNGEPCVITTLEDISDRKQAALELAKFKLGIDRSYYSVMITAIDGTILYINPAFTKIYGYTAAEALGRKPNLLKSGTVTPEQYERFWNRLLAGEIVMGEIINKTKDGRLIPVETNNSPILDENGQLIGFISMQSEISERKRAEAELQRSAQLLHTIIETVPDFLYIKNVKSEFIIGNQAVARAMGAQDPEELVGKTDFDFFARELAEKFYQDEQTVIHSGQPIFNTEEPGLDRNGEPLWVITTKVPFRNSAGEIEGVVGVGRDITERRNMEADLLVRNRQLATFNRVGQELAQLVTVQEVVEHVFAAMSEILDTRNLYIALYDDGKQEVAFPIYTMEGERHTVASRPFSNGITEHVLTTKKVLWIPRDVQGYATSLGMARLVRPSRCYLGVPLLSGDKALGVIAVQDYEHEDCYTTADAELLSAIAAQAAAALENVRLYAVESRRAVQLQTAAEISTAAGTVLDIAELLPVVVDLIQQRFSLYYVGLFLIDEAQQAAVLRAGTGEVGRQVLARQHQLPLDDQSMIGWSIHHRVPRIARDVGDDAARFNNPELPNTRSELALPLVSRGQVLGAMTVQSTEAAAFNDQDIAILQTMSDQVATAIANAQLFEQASQARRQAEVRLRETQFLQSVGQTVSSSLDLSAVMDVVMNTLQDDMGFTHNALYLVDRKAGTVTTTRAQGTASQLRGLTRSLEQLRGDILLDILEKGKIDVIDGWDDRFDREIYETQGHAALVRAFVPLRLRGESIGLLEVGYRRTERARITPEEVRLLSGLADQIAIAVGNARLFNESQQRITELAVVNEISRTLTVSHDAQQLCVTIHEQVGRLFDAANFYIATYDGGEEWSLDYQFERGQLLPPTRHKLGGGFTSYILQTRQSILIRTQQDNFDFHDQQNLPRIGETAKSWMGVPLIVGGATIGVMAIQSYEHEELYTDHDVTLFSTIGTQAAAAIQNVRLFQEARLRAAELTALNELSQTLAAQLNVNQVLQEVWHGVSHLLDTTNFYIALYDHEREEISFPINASESVLDKEIEVMPADQGLTGYILRTRQPLLISEDTQRRVEELGLESVGGTSQSYLGVPLILGEQVLGVMAIQSYSRARLYNEHDQNLLTAIAGQAAIALQNARLFNETQQRSTELATLNQIISSVAQTLDLRTLLDTVLKQTLEAFGFDGGLITMFNETRGKLERIVRTGLPGRIPDDPAEGLENSLCAYVYNSRESLVIEDFRDGAPIDVSGEIESGYYSYIGIPLEARGHMLGTWCGFRKSAGTFGKSTLALLQAASSQLSFAIENARLFDETRARARREQTLREITARVRSSTDPDAIAQTAIRELGLALGRQTFIRLGDAEQLSRPSHSDQDVVPASGNGHEPAYEGGE